MTGHITFPQKPIIKLDDTHQQILSKIDLYITAVHNWLKETHSIKDESWKDNKGAWMNQPDTTKHTSSLREMIQEEHKRFPYQLGHFI